MEITQEQLEYLKQLKETDRFILATKTEKEGAPTLFKRLDGKVAEAQMKQQKASKNLEEAELAHIQAEEEIVKAKDRLVRAKEKLQNITNDHEFKAANKEVIQIGDIIHEKTGELPGVAEMVAVAKQDLESKEQILKTAEEARNSCPVDIDKLYEQLDSKLKGMGSEREGITKNIDKSILDIYEKKLLNRRGLALVSALDGRCHGCNVKIRPQKYNQILKGSLEECEACRRLMYAGN